MVVIELGVSLLMVQDLNRAITKKGSTANQDVVRFGTAIGNSSSNGVSSRRAIECAILGTGRQLTYSQKEESDLL
jgi:hypothetical protein